MRESKICVGCGKPIYRKDENGWVWSRKKMHNGISCRREYHYKKNGKTKFRLSGKKYEEKQERIWNKIMGPHPGDKNDMGMD